MRAVVLATLSAFAVCVAHPALTAEANAALYLRSDQAYNARWDRCEALARKNGTPPGKIGYGEFINDCVGKYPANHARTPVAHGTTVSE